jgi:hypothetical protein
LAAYPDGCWRMLGHDASRLLDWGMKIALILMGPEQNQSQPRNFPSINAEGQATPGHS